MTSRARAARRAVHYLPDSSASDDNDLDHRVSCQWCDRPYLVVGTGWDRRIQPDHLPTCRWFRPPVASGSPGAPRSATQAPEVPEGPPERYQPAHERPGFTGLTSSYHVDRALARTTTRSTTP